MEEIESLSGPVRPDYGGRWVGAVVPALLGEGDASVLPAPARDTDAVVLLVLDGVGWTALERRREQLPTLAAMEGDAITTVAPSTTGAALTSITTGLAPARHGIVGYRMRVAGEILNVLRWPSKDGRPVPDPADVQPHAPFGGAAVPVLTRAEFTGSGFSGAHLRGTQLVGWRTTGTLVELVRRCVADGAQLVYAYYDGVDRVAHAHGLQDGLFDGELRFADRLVDDLLAVLPAEVALVVVADHGQVHVPREAVLPLDELDRWVGTYSGEGRFRSLHAKAGATTSLRDAALDLVGEVALVFERDRLFDEGWLGADAGPLVRGRLGDVVLVPFAPVAFRDPTDPREADLLGRHGGLTADEVLVPLLAARGRA